MSLNAELDLLRRVPVLRMVAPSAQKLLCFGGERIAFEAGQAIFREGDVSDAVYIVIEGAVESLAAPAAAPQFPAASDPAVESPLLGQTGVLAALPRAMTAVAITRVEALRIPREMFLAAIQDHPEAAMDLINVLSRRLAASGPARVWMP
jgi:CRP-like cAMP-binding protein